ncbi:hypothetical protein GQ53DRAFT_887691 [Thozetella sp. PMI_491]|nr:hypothetical protein GQ53DRAFT_887691 [Thozetella sp. PMI_491]
MASFSVPGQNPSDLGRGPAIVGVTWTFTVIAAGAVFLRLCVRKKVANRLGLDDWLMLLALPFQIVYQVFLTISYHYGMGKHDVDLQIPDELVQILKWNWWSLVPGSVVSVLARVSAAILLTRLFGVYRWFRWFMIVLTVLQTVATIVLVPCVFLQSDPVSGLWDVFNFTATHWDKRVVLYLQYVGQALFTFADLTFVLFPVMFIWKLNMPLQQRIGLMVLMAASLLTMAASILKLIAVQGASDLKPDAQYNASLEMLWVGLEQTFVIIMGCVPSLRSVLKLDGFRSLSSSLSSFLRRGDKSKASSMDNKSDPGTYSDLEMNTNRLGDLTGGGRPPITVGHY